MYILGNNPCDIQTPFFPKSMPLDVWHWTTGWNAHRIGILRSNNGNLINTSSVPQPEVKNNSIIVN